MNETANKKDVIRIASELGFQRTVIADLEPLTDSFEKYQGWLDRGSAAEMQYLKRDPIKRHSPASLVEGARRVIILSVSYYTERPPAPGIFYGQVAGYAVGLDYHQVLKQKIAELHDRLCAHFGRPLIGKCFSDDVQLNERALATRHGLGFSGKHTLVIGPKLEGTYSFIAELFTDLDLEPDTKYEGTCGQCSRCKDICPTKAISPPLGVDANLCISYLTIENKGEIPLSLRPKLGSWLFGCDLCQEICPYNQRPPETPWHEFRPESGVGHYLDVMSLFTIRTTAEFRERFGATPLSRPKRQGLVRNALVVAGNIIRANSVAQTIKPEIELGLRKIFDFTLNEENEMLREHAVWALAQSPTELHKRYVEELARRETDLAQRKRYHQHLETTYCSLFSER